MIRNPYYRGPVSDHFDGVRFHGPGPVVDKSRRDLLRLMFGTRFAKWPSAIAGAPVPPPAARIEGAALRVTSIGHASLLVQTRGLNILIDPVWSRRASPVSFAGPRRVRPPGIALEDLPPIDIVLVTHNHYDHLDLATLAALDARMRPRLIVPLGNDTLITRKAPQLRPEAFDWGDTVGLSNDVSVTLVPSHHWSARGLWDRRMALWTAYVLETPDGAIYHVGDTAYRDEGTIFRAIPRRFGPPRLAILPIGAYAPRWFMRDEHVDPSEAVAILQDCEAHFALAHHWGTFQLTSEPIDEPPQRLVAALMDAGIDPERFRIQPPGASFDVPPLAGR